MVKRAMLASLLALGLAGCGGGSDVQTASLSAGPLAAGKARVTISRPSTIVYAAAPATITLNGQKVADTRLQREHKQALFAPVFRIREIETLVVHDDNKLQAI